jgi:hypothetical protein
MLMNIPSMALGFSSRKAMAAGLGAVGIAATEATLRTVCFLTHPIKAPLPRAEPTEPDD